MHKWDIFGNQKTFIGFLMVFAIVLASIVIAGQTNITNNNLSAIIDQEPIIFTQPIVQGV